jgi:hypothetical protein
MESPQINVAIEELSFSLFQRPFGAVQYLLQQKLKKKYEAC